MITDEAFAKMNALQRHWARLEAYLTPANLADLQAAYRADAAADSRASYRRGRERQRKARERRVGGALKP